ncbi:cation transport-related protein [Linnemannia elongata AG-77]|uniref:Cation transport-related protein n=1 Tax=Linnemannia elongata AG-77 TaxID=1314771 RepID=A0A197K0V7_9FUNG|nr:cation transport-related protein [Linnemannia elongata AG-77]
MALTCSDIFKFIFAVIFPPLGVLLERGCGPDLLINILLTILGFIPGMLYSLTCLLDCWKVR